LVWLTLHPQPIFLYNGIAGIIAQKTACNNRFKKAVSDVQSMEGKTGGGRMRRKAPCPRVILYIWKYFHLLYFFLEVGACMTIRKRSIVMAALLIFALTSYGIARYYTPSLILHVVEQSIIQKAPPGIKAQMVHQRLHSLLSEMPDQNSRMERLLRISQYLEKIQHLTTEEWNGLFPDAKLAESSVL
jgi:hypothetical protein